MHIQHGSKVHSSTVSSLNANAKHSLGPKSVAKPGHLLFGALTSDDTGKSKLVELY